VLKSNDLPTVGEVKIQILYISFPKGDSYLMVRPEQFPPGKVQDENAE